MSDKIPEPVRLVKEPDGRLTWESPAQSELAPARGSAALSDRELVQEMLQCLRLNMMRETMTTVDDEQFWKFLDAWSSNRSALGIAPSNDKLRHAAPDAQNATDGQCGVA